MLTLLGDPNNAYGPLDEAEKGAKWIEYGADHAWLWFGGSYLDGYFIGWGRVFFGRFVFTTNPEPDKREVERGINRLESIIRAAAETKKCERWELSPSEIVLYGIWTMNLGAAVSRLLDRMGKATDYQTRQTIRNKLNGLMGYQHLPLGEPNIVLRSRNGAETLK